MGLEHCTANIQIKHFIRPEKLSEKQENLCQVILSSWALPSYIVCGHTKLFICTNSRFHLSLQDEWETGSNMGKMNKPEINSRWTSTPPF